jgi:hypothetical protein
MAAALAALIAPMPLPHAQAGSATGVFYIDKGYGNFGVEDTPGACASRWPSSLDVIFINLVGVYNGDGLLGLTLRAEDGNTGEEYMVAGFGGTYEAFKTPPYDRPDEPLYGPLKTDTFPPQIDSCQVASLQYASVTCSDDPADFGGAEIYLIFILGDGSHWDFTAAVRCQAAPLQVGGAPLEGSVCAFGYNPDSPSNVCVGPVPGEPTLGTWTPPCVVGYFPCDTPLPWVEFSTSPSPRVFVCTGLLSSPDEGGCV